MCWMREKARFNNSYPKVEYTRVGFVKDTGNIRQRNPEEQYFQKLQVLLTFQILQCRYNPSLCMLCKIMVGDGSCMNLQLDLIVY